MRVLILIMSLVSVLQCNAQNEKKSEKTIVKNSKTKKMKRPSINNKFETLNLDDYKNELKIEKKWSIGDKTYHDWYEFKKETENEIIGIDGNANAGLRYGKTLKNSIYAISKIYYWKNGYIKSKSILTQFTGIRIGEEYQFDESGKLIKTIDHDKDWDFSYEDVMAFVKEKYKDKVLAYDVAYAFNIKKKKSYDNRNYWEVFIKPDFNEKNQDNLHRYDLIKLDGNTGEILCYQQWTDYYGEPETLRKTIVPDATIPPSARPSAKIYKTHEGKTYTKAEWQAYEEKEYEAYCKRTGRPYTPKNQEAKPESQDNRKSFLADDFETGDKNIPKKKKGFWG